jgi:hypothetical protein
MKTPEDHAIEDRGLRVPMKMIASVSGASGEG